MNYYKKLLKVFFLSILCISNHNLDARISNNSWYAIMATGLGAASYLGYILYHNFYTNTITLRHDEALTVKFIETDNQADVFIERLNLIQNLLKDEDCAEDFDVRVFALILFNRSDSTCESIIQEMKSLAHRKNCPISMDLFQEALMYDNSYTIHQHDRLEQAYHQAAYAIAAVELMNPYLTVYSLRLSALNSSNNGVIFSPIDTTDFDAMENYFYDKIMCSLAGGVGEQLCNVSPLPRVNNSIKEDDIIESPFIDLISRLSFLYDRENALQDIEILFYLDYLNRTDTAQNIDDFKIDRTDQLKFMKILYEEIYTLLSYHKDKIEKLAHLLVEKDIVYADEVYALCGKQRPLFYFEKK